MLTSKQLQEIREKLESSQNPLFFFDNDVDGLCSFLILQRAIGRGKGVAIRSFPDLGTQYLRKIEELNPDAIFILDKPVVSPEFIDEVNKKNLPIVWIDHHGVDIEQETLEKVSYYNSFPTSEPVTYLSQKVFNRNEDLWLAMIGCIGDVYMPDFAKEFAEKNPELFPIAAAESPAFDSLYTTEIGNLVTILNFALKDTTTNVVRLCKFLYKSKNAHDLLEENTKTRQIHKRYNELNSIYKKLVCKAEAQMDENSNLLLFTYSGETSMSSEVANCLYFKHNEKFIAVGYKRQDKINFSIRGKKAKMITEKVVSEIENARGGGHEQATGAQIPSDRLEEFKQKIQSLLNQK